MNIVAYGTVKTNMKIDKIQWKYLNLDKIKLNKVKIIIGKYSIDSLLGIL